MKHRIKCDPKLLAGSMRLLIWGENLILFGKSIVQLNPRNLPDQNMDDP